MIEIAKSFDEPHKNAYLDAAQLFRLPYWDFYRPRKEKETIFPGVVQGQKASFPFDYSVPKILSESNIMVRKPPHNKLEVLDRNPLGSFEFSKFKVSDKEWGLLFASIIAQKLKKDGKLVDPPEELKEQRRVELKYKIPHEQTVRHPRSPKKDHEKWSHGTERLKKIMNELRMDTNRLVLHMMGCPEYDVYEVFATSGKKSIILHLDMFADLSRVFIIRTTT